MSPDPDAASASQPLKTAAARAVEASGVPDTGRAVSSAAPAGAKPVRPIASESLFAGASEVHISHRGALYRLKQTALGKLILTK